MKKRLPNAASFLCVFEMFSLHFCGFWEIYARVTTKRHLWTYAFPFGSLMWSYANFP